MSGKPKGKFLEKKYYEKLNSRGECLEFLIELSIPDPFRYSNLLLNVGVKEFDKEALTSKWQYTMCLNISLKASHFQKYFMKFFHTLESGIEVGPTVINLAFFSRPYGLIKGPTY